METALKAEVEDFLSSHAQKLATGSLGSASPLKRIVHNGYLPERQLLTPLGVLTLNIPRLRDRAEVDKIRFVSKLIPPFGRRLSILAAPLVWLYLKGLMTGDFQPALSTFLGHYSQPLTRGLRWRLKNFWLEDFEDFWGGPIKPNDFKFYWAQSSEPLKRAKNKALLALVGVTKEGYSTFLGLIEGDPFLAQDWAALFQKLRARGLTEPRPVVGDPEWGVWAGLAETFGPQDQNVPSGLAERLALVLNDWPPESKTAVAPIFREISQASDFATIMTGSLKIAERFGSFFPTFVAQLWP
jgi:transposase-like protein